MAACLELGAKFLGEIEDDLLLDDSRSAHRSGIDAAVTGIENNDRLRIASCGTAEQPGA